jgi:phytoene desaturase (3,4-didehydrolycopene-forming)
MARQKSALVVGAGAGGIATAARLAAAGFKVTVLEKNDFTGGRCSLIHHDGYVCGLFMGSSGSGLIPAAI